MAFLLAAVSLALADGLVANVVAYERDTGVFYYPLTAWIWEQIRVHGHEQPLLRGNRLFRVVPVPAGSQIVTFHFELDSVRLGAALSAAALALILSGIATGLRAQG